VLISAALSTPIGGTATIVETESVRRQMYDIGAIERGKHMLLGRLRTVEQIDVRVCAECGMQYVAQAIEFAFGARNRGEALLGDARAELSSV
jgi:hypothetical protein